MGHPAVVASTRATTFTQGLRYLGQTRNPQMPLPNDEKLLALSQDLLNQFDTIFGLHPGFRPAHAKGIMLTGHFTPSAEAVSLTRAPHVTRETTPVTVRSEERRVGKE